MSRSRIVPILMSLLVLGVAAPAFAVPMDWGYGEPGGKLAPEEWDMISATCGTGQQQSPIDFQQSRLSDTHSRVRTSNLPDIAFDYHATEIVLKNTGHNIEVEYESTPESAVTVGPGAPFDVVQFHFHAPAEHTFEDGAAFPMELHIVHRSADNRLAVVGVMIREGQENAVLADLWDLLTDAANLVPNANDEYDSGEEIRHRGCAPGRPALLRLRRVADDTAVQRGSGVARVARADRDVEGADPRVQGDDRDAPGARLHVRQRASCAALERPQDQARPQPQAPEALRPAAADV